MVCLERNAPPLAFPGIPDSLPIDDGSPQCFTFAGYGDRAVLKCNPIYLTDRTQDMFCGQTLILPATVVPSAQVVTWNGSSRVKNQRGYQWSLVCVSFVLCQIGLYLLS